MFKFLFYLFIIYILYRLVFGRFLKSSFKTKVFRNTQNRYYYTSKTEQESEGKITVNPKIKQETKGNSPKIGEYIDYEDITEK